MIFFAWFGRIAFSDLLSQTPKKFVIFFAWFGRIAFSDLLSQATKNFVFFCRIQRIRVVRSVKSSTKKEERFL
jgi:hypothetical protein